MTSSADYPFTNGCGDGQGWHARYWSKLLHTGHLQSPGSGQTHSPISRSLRAPYGSPIVIPLQGTGISGTPGPSVAVAPAAPCILPSATDAVLRGCHRLRATRLSTGSSTTWQTETRRSEPSRRPVFTPRRRTPAPTSSRPSARRRVPSTAFPRSPSAARRRSRFIPSLPLSRLAVSRPSRLRNASYPDTNVTYTVDNIAGGNCHRRHSVPTAGVYTAPPTPGNHTVRVTDSSLNHTSGGVVTAFTGITADFGSRANNTAPIPADMLGYGRGESIHNTSDRELLTQAGLTESRLSALITLVYATPTPDWTKIDPIHRRPSRAPASTRFCS